VRYFRPPWGLLSPGALVRLSRRRLAVVQWSAWGEDTSHTDPRRVVDRVAPGLVPGAIVLLHDACGDLLAPGGFVPPGYHADRAVTVAALPGILAALRAADLRSVALPAQPVRAAHAVVAARLVRSGAAR
jgi:peptidoglycan/xylan/chitin deacetylase (PgdA/CDA1 family)